MENDPVLAAIDRRLAVLTQEFALARANCTDLDRARALWMLIIRAKAGDEDAQSDVAKLIETMPETFATWIARAYADNRNVLRGNISQQENVPPGAVDENAT